MQFLRRSRSKWPLSIHIVLSVAAVLFAAWMFKDAQQFDIVREAREAELTALQASLQSVKARDKPPVNPISSLPSVASVDHVVQVIAQRATELGVHLNSLGIESSPLTARELGRVQLTISASAEYRAFKQWVAEILGRHPSMALQQLSLRGSPRDAVRPEIQLSLVFFTKD